MPTHILDSAAAATQDDIQDAISIMNQNLGSQKKKKKKQSANGNTSSPARHHHADYSSSLFRDEVVQQEMRYFDSVLRADNGVGGCGYNVPPYNPTLQFGGQSNERLSSKTSRENQRQSTSPYRSTNSTVPASNRQHRTPNRSRSHVRSRNTRHQTNRRLMQKAKISSRRVMRKLSGIGQRCSQKWGLVTNAIHNQILVTVANMSSLLENGSLSGQAGVSSRPHHVGNTASQTQNSFVDISMWIKNRTQNISSKALVKAKRTLRKRNNNVSFMV